MINKTCTLCHKEKPMEEFSKLSCPKGKATHYARCKKCRAELWKKGDDTRKRQAKKSFIEDKFTVTNIFPPEDIMTAIESETEMRRDIRYSPCEVCNVRGSCETNCLRFNVFVNQESVLRREQDFLRFAEKMK